MRLYGTLTLSLLLVALLLNTYNMSFRSNYLQALSDKNQEFANQIETANQYTEYFLQNLANQLFYTREVVKLRTYKALTNTQQIEGIRALNTFAASSSIIDSIYVYNGQMAYIFSTASYGAVSDYVPRFADTTATELFSHRTMDQRLTLFSRISYSNTASAALGYSFMFYELDSMGDSSDNAIMFNLNRDWITGLFFSATKENASFIMDASGSLIANQEGLEESLIRELSQSVLEYIRDADQEADYFLLPIGGRDIVCFYSKMEKNNWYYVCPVDYQECLGSLYKVGRTAYLFLIVGCIALGTIGIFASLSVYLPFRKFTKRLTVVEPDAEQSTEQLMSSLNRLIEQHSDSENLRRTLEEVIHSQILRDLLRGTHQYDQAEEFLAAHKLEITSSAPLSLCLVSGLRVNQYLQAIRPMVSGCEGVEIQNDYSVLLLQTEVPGQVLTALESLCKRYPSTYFVLGPVFSEWEKIPEVYAGLLDIYELRFLRPEQRLLYFEELPALTRSSADLNEMKDQLILQLKKGFYNRAMVVWQDFRQALSGKSYATVRFSLTNLGTEVLRLLCDSDPAVNFDTACHDLSAMVDGLQNIDTFEEFLRTRCLQVATYFQQEHKLRQGNSIQDIMDFCQERYHDPELSSQMLASQFDFSVAYLCRIFRQANGCSVMDYINTLRVQKAQEILADPNVLVKDVPLQVGVENRQYFFKLFKQITGKTPKQYQMDLRGKRV